MTDLIDIKTGAGVQNLKSKIRSGMIASPITNVERSSNPDENVYNTFTMHDEVIANMSKG